MTVAQFQITLSDDILHDLFVGDDVARLLEEIMNQVLQAKITEYLRAEPYERTPERQGQRNGYKTRKLTTRGWAP
jgi:transposase-like protein